MRSATPLSLLCLSLACTINARKADDDTNDGQTGADARDEGRDAAPPDDGPPSSRVVGVALGEPSPIIRSAAIRQFPWVAAVGDNVLVGYSQHLDGYVPSPVLDGMSISRDGGATWPEVLEIPDFGPIGLVHLQDGTLLGVSYITRRVDPLHARCDVWTSTDLGKTWQHASGTLVFPQEQGIIGADWGGLLFHRGLIEEPDGSIVGSVYGRYLSDGTANTRAMWVRSTDRGATWNVVSTIAFDPNAPGQIGWAEPVVARVADGSLLAILRIAEQPMRQVRSVDGGLTWSNPEPLPGVPAELTRSVDPDLLLTSDGVLVMSYGRPGASLLISSDGSGYRWERYLPTATAPTTGYTGVRELSPGRLILVGDRGKFANPYEIWRRDVGLTTQTIPGTRLELGAMIRTGAATVTTNMTYVDPVGLPGTGVGGATDRSLAYSYSAFKSGADGPGEYTLALDRAYQIRSIGVLLKVGYPESAEVSFSLDGVTWDPPAVSFVEETQTHVAYTTFDAPIAARYVRLRITASGWPGLNELELFADDAPRPGRHAFGDQAVGATPDGFVVTGGTAAVGEVDGERALHVTDESAEAISRVVRPIVATTAARVELKIFPVALPSGALIDLAQGSEAGVHLAVMQDGSLSYYDGAWRVVAPAGTVPMGAWSTIRIEALSPGRAALFVGGRHVGSAGRYRDIAAIDGVSFSSGSTAGTGDEFYVDDVDVR